MEPKIQMLPSSMNEEGKPMNEEEIRSASQSWTHEDWRTYLKSLEVGLKESQPSLIEIESLGLASSIFEIGARTCSDELSQWMEKLISTLSDKQKFVIEKYFFEGRSERQIAKMMMISRQGVFDLKKRAIRKLRKNAPKVLATFPIVEAQVGFESHELEMVRESQEKGEVSC